uniref:Uncharacterized protein n=1 Tax=Chlamydomonas euryale TaxID=1486919 RepID=A0A7R9VUT7_9CHLO|mmetsp:Transcript_4859/g.14792  ORF Transcript_4859/g.14792 Transcript_4859/m.14792 type:complete len:453 (+) Transcript_4859:339-1697(+)
MDCRSHAWQCRRCGGGAGGAGGGAGRAFQPSCWVHGLAPGAVHVHSLAPAMARDARCAAATSTAAAAAAVSAATQWRCGSGSQRRSSGAGSSGGSSSNNSSSCGLAVSAGGISSVGRGASQDRQRPPRRVASLRCACSTDGDGNNAASGGNGGGVGGGKSAPSRALLERIFRMADIADSAELSDEEWQANVRAIRPNVDWSRYNLQLLFVDRSGTLRARFAAGIFERIAEWNGYGRVIIPSSAGLQAVTGTATDESAGESVGAAGAADAAAGAPGASSVHGPPPPPLPASVSGVDRMAAIWSAGSSLGLVTRLLARPAEAFDADYDLEFYDLVLTMDTDLYEELLSKIPPEHLEHYKKKICLLTSFSDYESEGTMLARGGLALLPRQLSNILQPGFTASKGLVDVPSPDFASKTAMDEYSSMVQALILACGGLCKYLIDAWPEDMPDYDPIE